MGYVFGVFTRTFISILFLLYRKNVTQERKSCPYARLSEGCPSLLSQYSYSPRPSTSSDRIHPPG